MKISARIPRSDSSFVRETSFPFCPSYLLKCKCCSNQCKLLQLNEYSLTSFDTFQTHFGTKLCTCDSYLLAKVNITLVMFIIKFVFEGKDQLGRSNEYKVWYQNEFRKCQRMSMGTRLKLDIRTSYLPSIPTISIEFLKKNIWSPR